MANSLCIATTFVPGLAAVPVVKRVLRRVVALAAVKLVPVLVEGPGRGGCVRRLEDEKRLESWKRSCGFFASSPFCLTAFVGLAISGCRLDLIFFATGPLSSAEDKGREKLG